MLQEIMPFVSKHPIISLVWVALLVAVILLTFKGMFSKVKIIPRSTAIILINKEEAIVVDTRTRDDFRRGHIIDAVNLTPSEIKDNNLGEVEKHKSRPVILVSANGMDLGKPAESMIKAGFERVFVLKDGLSGWTGDNLPLSRSKK
ncbi:MAG: rhodanese-like domain-containing protein [Morganella sp. (in: enterobacteria)]|uniref:Rhodanese-like domain-containing protein n=1 Tax=Morganella psychrotolerans TaxID=368603 RepID=A0A1B8HLK2_9GAMM|nr:rhodanese-like domain-containing protein [Morganella psychrotolerans]OBU10267.1 rhodanese-like domain-containing protein [Morganella psychrotolerans]HCM64423.1 rhodanese-like domain-containing protein [Morganella sp. (in: enterobacteria)]